MIFGQLAVSLAWLPLFLSPATSPVSVASAEPPRQLTVMITSSGYEPSTLTVRSGDVVRFIQQDVRAHNIEFQRAPEGTRFASEYVAPPGDIEILRAMTRAARVGPMLIGRGRAYEIRIGEEMRPGVYLFGCSHHSKWRGRLVVDGPEGSP